MESQARDDLTDAMCKKEMGVYTAIFGTTGDTAALERTDRRYLWLRKRLGSRQEVRTVDFRVLDLDLVSCRLEVVSDLSLCRVAKALWPSGRQGRQAGEHAMLRRLVDRQRCGVVRQNQSILETGVDAKTPCQH